jgi:hypothetical protein
VLFSEETSAFAHGHAKWQVTCLLLLCFFVRLPRLSLRLSTITMDGRLMSFFLSPLLRCFYYTMLLKLALVLAASLRACATSSSFYIPYHNIYIDTNVLATRRRNKTLSKKPASLFHSFGITATYNPITCLPLTPGRSNI